MIERKSSRNILGRLGLVATACAVAGPALAWVRLVPGLVGFGLFALGGLLAVIVSVATVIRLARGHRVGLGGGVAIVTGACFLILASGSGSAPRINDFTTDVADPPAFRHARSLPANAGRDLAYPAGFAPLQQECCADLRPARVKASAADALERARRIAERMPHWKITATDADGGTIEAVATTRIFGFQDDIAIRVRADGPSASRVDIRSKSRDGQGDLGTNANRIRAFVAELERPETMSRGGSGEQENH
jgi:uncharacterized protein (DUF1499 family)